MMIMKKMLILYHVFSSVQFTQLIICKKVTKMLAVTYVELCWGLLNQPAKKVQSLIETHLISLVFTVVNAIGLYYFTYKK